MQSAAIAYAYVEDQTLDQSRILDLSTHNFASPEEWLDDGIQETRRMVAHVIEKRGIGVSLGLTKETRNGCESVFWVGKRHDGDRGCECWRQVEVNQGPADEP